MPLPSDNTKPDLSRLSIPDSQRALEQASATNGTRSGTWLGFAAGILLTLLGFWIFWGNDSDYQAPVTLALKNSDTAFSGQPAPPQTNEFILNAAGYVVAQRKAAVSSKATGRLKELRVQEGDVVKKDQILGVLENEDLLAQVAEQQASLAAGQSRLLWAEAELRNAESIFLRTEKLAKEKISSVFEVEAAEARLTKAKADLTTADSNIDVVKARLTRANVELEYSHIRAPFDGTVLTKNADIGEIVAPFGSSANARAAIVTIADMASLQVEADISEANFTKLFIGQSATITLDSFPDKFYRGTVVKIVPTVDRAKATVLAKIEFTEQDQNVLPEMSAKITLQMKR